MRPDPDAPPRVIERVSTDDPFADLDLPRWYDYPAVLDEWPLDADIMRSIGDGEGGGAAMTTYEDDMAPEPLLTCPVEYVRTAPAAISALRSKELMNSDRMWAGQYRDPGTESDVCLREFVQNDITFTNGERHRERRKLLNQLVRPVALDWFRDEIIVPQAMALLPRFVTGPHPDGQYRLNLVQFCDTVFLHFAARFIGLVDVDSYDRIRVLRELVSPISAAFTSAFYMNRAEIHEAALAAKSRFVEEFFLPSLEAQREQRSIASDPAGDKLPLNFLQLVVSGAHPDYEDEQQAIREALILFNATVGTSTQTIVNTVADLGQWLVEHPEDVVHCQEPGFLLDAMQESLRPRSPFTAYQFRIAASNTVIREQLLVKGQEVRISIPAVNRDRDVFGADAAEFNPRRVTSGGLKPYGLAFSVGIHQCLASVNDW